MMSQISTFRKIFLTACVVIICSCFHNLHAQAAPAAKSRIAVVCNDTKTNIWVSDFPKKTCIVIMDTEDNLLTITTTNDYGACYISLPKEIKTGVIAKTVNGEIMVSNKAVAKNQKDEQNVVATNTGDTDKA